MSYTAIVLDSESIAKLRARARGLFGDLPANWIEKLHHVTLCMGTREVFNEQIGQRRVMRVVSIGEIEGRVLAFGVDGARDSDNKTPHITIAHAHKAKPRESNDITLWETIPPDDRFEIIGTITVCD